MTQHVKKIAFLHGLCRPEPVIPGFVVHREPGSFVTVTQGDKLFYVISSKGGFKLVPSVSGKLHLDQTVFIPV